ncbi:MAG: alkaline phosphatase family protein, partial [Candidatus Cybelea sp.]
MSVKRFFVVASLALIVPACSSSGSTPAVLMRALPQSGSPSQYIKNVVVIVQENRSLENFFTGYPGADAPTSGCAIPHGTPQARAIRQVVRRASSSGCPSGDISVPLKSITFDGHIDLAHNWDSSMADYDKGKMDGFSKWGKPGEYEAY